MSRRACLLSISLILLVVLATVWWKMAARPAPRPVLVVLSLDLIESNRLMAQWRCYAEEQPAAIEDLHTVADTLALMNEHAERAFPEGRLNFMLWQQSMPAPRGYSLNPSRTERQATGDSLLVGEVQPHGTLSLRTDELLRRNRFRIQVIDGQGYVFEKEAFVPHLVTQPVAIPPDVARRWKTDYGWGGSFDISWMLEFRRGELQPRTRATLSADCRILTIETEEADLDRAIAGAEMIIGEFSDWAVFKRDLRARVARLWKSLQEMLP